MYSHQNGIKLRKLSRGDLSNLLTLKWDSWGSRHRINFVNMDDQQAWFDSLSKDTITPKELILVASARGPNNRYDIDVGIFKLTYIDWQNRKADVGWDIFEKYRGKGYGKRMVEAGVGFCKEVLSLHRLKAEILTNNGPSYGCAKAAGFEQEGVERDCVLRNGQYTSSIIMGNILEERWVRKTPPSE